MDRWFVLSASILLAMACGPADEGPTGGADAGEGDSTVADMRVAERASEAEAAAACNALQLDAPAVGLTYDTAAPPAPMGGAIADGTYFLTTQLVYETASGPTFPLGRSKVTIAGPLWHEVYGDPEPNSVNPDKRTTSTMIATGTSLTLTRTCPSAGQPEITTYTADATRLTLFIEDRNKTIGTVFVKQP
jgi:hypothetical protein